MYATYAVYILKHLRPKGLL